MTINNPFKPRTQNHRILERLKFGPVTNVELARDFHILKYSGRISEVREFLQPYLVDVHAERVPGTGTFVYSLKGNL